MEELVKESEEKMVKQELNDMRKIKTKGLVDFYYGFGFGFVYMLMVLGVGLLLKYDFKVIGFTLICCGVYGLYINIIEELRKRK